VEVYERKPVMGGKSRSIPIVGSGTGGRRDLPGEHGFRFFPPFKTRRDSHFNRWRWNLAKGGSFAHLSSSGMDNLPICSV
jgi:hypothetical protein